MNGESKQNWGEYGQTCNMVLNLTKGVSEKIGSLTGYGYKLEGDAPLTWDGADGRACAQNEISTFYEGNLITI
jgi:hypothetical protein